jgi:uncharacterized protein (DUF736 family)
MQYDNTNSGTLFKNDKGDNDKRPDYKGKIDINGTEYNLSAWVRDMKSGNGKYLSLKADAKKDTPVAKHIAAQDDNDEIPF